MVTIDDMITGRSLLFASLGLCLGCSGDGDGSRPRTQGDFAPIGLGGNEIAACYEVILACLPASPIDHYDRLAIEISAVTHRDGVETGVPLWPPAPTSDPGLDYVFSAYQDYADDVPDSVAGTETSLWAAIEESGGARLVFKNDTATGEYEGGIPIVLDVGLAPVESARGRVLPATINGAWLEAGVFTLDDVSYPEVVALECIVPSGWRYATFPEDCP